MNNKGFTLVELLVVIVILIAIVTLAIPSITSSMERSKNKINNSKLEVLASASELYLNQVNRDEIEKFKEGGCYIILDDLKNAGYIDDDDMKDADGENFGKYLYYEETIQSTSDEPSKEVCKKL